MHLKDGDLVRASQSGDSAAFAELVKRYESKVFRLGLKMLRNEQDAEDILQETFVSVFRHLDEFRGAAEFSTWVYRIATNASLMKIRSRRPTDSLDEPVDSADTAGDGAGPRDLVDWSATPEDVLLNGETRLELDAALLRLPATWRSVFVLRDIEGLSVAETAQALSISEPNVKTRLHRARLALRDALAVHFSERSSLPGKTKSK